MRVAIAWYGAEGEASYKYFASRGDDVTIVTPKLSPDFPLPVGAKSLIGPDVFDNLNGFDLVVRSAGVRPDSLKTDGKIWSATNEFFSVCRAPIIGITGTKGKGTTSSLIASILSAAGKKVHLLGNIGVPPLGSLTSIGPDDIVVYELSSFQLWDLQYSPHIAVVLMIEPDHLNVHESMEEYVNAKANIRRYQTLEDTCYYHPTNEHARQIAETGNWPEDEYERQEWLSEARRYAVPDDAAVYASDGYFMVRGQPVCPTSSLQLPGEFNIQNACAAISAARNFTVDPAAIENGLRAFKGLPHRLKFVAEKQGVKYYDDSIATTPGSAIAALASFDGPKVIILGGESKGAEYSGLISAAKKADAKIIAVGLLGRDIEQLAGAQGIEVRYVDGLMDEVVPAAADMAGGQGVVLLSPAATSLDQYHSYAERGDKFIAAVDRL